MPKHTHTIDDIYAAINPLPALLSGKGKRSPDARFEVRANGVAIDFLNPLTETMKRLSENIITHQPRTSGGAR